MNYISHFQTEATTQYCTVNVPFSFGFFFGTEETKHGRSISVFRHFSSFHTEIDESTFIPCLQLAADCNSALKFEWVLLLKYDSVLCTTRECCILLKGRRDEGFFTWFPLPVSFAHTHKTQAHGSAYAAAAVLQTRELSQFISWNIKYTRRKQLKAAI